MIVLSDTSPVNYLILTGDVDILPALFGQVVIPAAVLDELRHANTPDTVRQWIGNLPAWLQVRSPTQVDPRLRLGHGEAEAISLAVEMHADLLLMDDRRARREAKSRGLSVAGTLQCARGCGTAEHVISPHGHRQVATNELSHRGANHSARAQRGRRT